MKFNLLCKIEKCFKNIFDFDKRFGNVDELWHNEGVYLTAKGAKQAQRAQRKQIVDSRGAQRSDS
jgi:NADP-dependent 3-hydroxy acid dehydrogenase YdfG